MGVKILEDRPLRYRDAASALHEIPTWRLIVRVGGKRHEFRSDADGNRFTDFRRADIFRARLVTDIQNQRFDPDKYRPAKKWTFGGLAKDYLDTLDIRAKAGEIGKAQAAKSRKVFEQVYIPTLGSIEIEDLRAYDLDRALRKMQEQFPGWGKKTQHNMQAIISAFLTYLHRREVIQRVPPLPQLGIVPKPARKWITAEVQDQVLAEIPETARPIFHLLCRMGLRPGEARALQLRDVDLDRGYITIQRSYRDSGSELKAATKTGTSRVLPIPEELTPAIRARLNAAVGPETPLFSNPSTGRPWIHGALSTIWRSAATKVGAEVGMYEGTRHSVASQALNRGVPMILIQAVLGHSNVSTTGGYAHAAPEKLRQVYNAQVISLPAPATK